MNLARIKNGKIVEFPILEGDFRLRFPLTTFPADLKPQDLPAGYVEVLDGDRPADVRWHRLEDGAPAKGADGVWRRTWQLIALDITFADKVAQVIGGARSIASALRAGVLPAEMAAWPEKVRAAQVVEAGGDAPLVLTAEAAARGIPAADLAKRILSKAFDFAHREAAIAGRLGAIKDAARAANSEAELLAIDIEAGWPK